MKPIVSLFVGAMLFQAAVYGQSVHALPGAVVPSTEASLVLGAGCKVNDTSTVSVCCNGYNTTVNKQKDSASGYKDGTATPCGTGASCTYTPLGSTKCGS